MIELDELPLLRVAEIAFLTSKLDECAKFYRGLGLGYKVRLDKKHIHFADVGEQFFGFAHKDRGFFSGYDNERLKVPLHIAFEVPSNQIDECTAFLTSKRIKCSPKVENSKGWHGARKSTSVYFQDPHGNIMELWAPQKAQYKKTRAHSRGQSRRFKGAQSA